MSPLAPAVIVFERSPRWEAELKRRLSAPQQLVRPCRSPADAAQLCRKSPGSVVVIDLAAGAADCLRLLGELNNFRPSPFPVVIGSRESVDLEWPARELGAAEFVTDLVGGEALAGICRRALEYS